MQPPPPVPDDTPPGVTGLFSTLRARLFNVFATPGEVFDEVRLSPSCTANWIVPAALFVLVGWLGAWLVFSQPAIQHQINTMTETALEKQFEKSSMSDAQKEAALQQARKWAGLGSKISGVAAPLLTAFCSPFWWGLIFWLLGNKLMQGRFELMKAVEVAGLSNMIAVLGSVVTTLLIVSLGTVFAVPGPVVFLKQFDPNNPAHGALALFNVMSLWALGVKSVGLSRLAGVSLVKAAAWVFGLWAVYSGVKIGVALAVQAFTRQ